MSKNNLLWLQALPGLTRRIRQDLLSDLAALLPVIETLGEQKALSETAEAIKDVGCLRSWNSNWHIIAIQQVAHMELHLSDNAARSASLLY